MGAASNASLNSVMARARGFGAAEGTSWPEVKAANTVNVASGNSDLPCMSPSMRYADKIMHHLDPEKP